jgi:methanogenic corrinoid protein MtbC1
MSMTSPLAQASQEIRRTQEALAHAVVARHYERQPGLAARYGEQGRGKCLTDAHYHLTYLAEALAAAQPSLFAAYIAWAKVMLAGRNIPAADLAQHLECLREVCLAQLPEDVRTPVQTYIEAGLLQFPHFPETLPSVLQDDHPLTPLAKQYLATLLRGERQRASILILEAVKTGVSIKDIYLYVFQQSQQEIGRLWQMNQVNIAQEHYCTAATQLIMSQLYPYIFATERIGHVFVGTCICGELHEIGLRIVSDLLELEGWDTFYLGANTPTESIVQTLREHKAEVLGISATMTFHLHAVSELIARVRTLEEGKGVKILVGGSPFNAASSLWQTVGADGSARDAQEATLIARRLIS